MSVCFDIPEGRPEHIMLIFDSPDADLFKRFYVYLTESECQEIAKEAPAFFALKKSERK